MGNADVKNILISFKEGRNSTKTIIEVNNMFNELNIFLKVEEPPLLFYLNDIGESDNEPEEIINPQSNLLQLANWPTGGWIEYPSSKCTFLVNFILEEKNFNLIGIYISEYSSNYNIEKEKNDKLVYHLHTNLNPYKTIVGENLVNEYNINKAFKEIREDKFTGIFDIFLSS